MNNPVHAPVKNWPPVCTCICSYRPLVDHIIDTLGGTHPLLDSAAIYC